MANGYRERAVITKIGNICLLFLSVFILLGAFLLPFSHMEIDTNALPVISLQYHASITVNQEDLDQAKIDFPTLYEGVDTYEELRASKLIKLSDEVWYPYYFPIYPLLCIPLKIFFSILNISQERTFSVTNACLVLIALWFVWRKLKVSSFQRLIAVVLLILSPILWYINYINYEAFMFSMVIISLVNYYNKNYKLSAFSLSLAGMSNSAVMAIGIVMIIAYLLEKYKKSKTIGGLVMENYKDVFLYALCYVPSLLPFIVPHFYNSNNIFSTGGSILDYWERFFSYLFDPSLGIFSFAPITLIIFFSIIGFSLVRKHWKSLIWLMFFLAVIAAVSLMPHINCGMIYCSRYLIWIYPIIPLFIVTLGYDAVKSISIKTIMISSMIMITSLMMFVNHDDAWKDREFNTITKEILNYCPSLYNPYSATFYCRTLHIDGAYQIESNAYYKDDETNQIRKLIYKATPENINQLQRDLYGDKESIKYLNEKIAEIGVDKKFHYLNFSKFNNHQLYEKNDEEKGLLQETDEVYSDENFQLYDNGEYFEKYLPIQLKNNTVYKVELKFYEQQLLDVLSKNDFMVDFYGADGTYDFPQQEARNFLQDNNLSYQFYWNSNEVGKNEKNIYARIIAVTSKEIQEVPIEYFRVVRMEQVKQ